MSPIHRLSPRVFGPPLLAGAVLIAGGGVAAGMTGAEAAKARIDHMKAMGAAMKAVGEQLKSGATDPAVIKVQVAKIDVGAKALDTWFPTGSGKDAYAKSQALPVVWTDPAGFETKAKALAAAAAKLDAAAQAGQAAAIGPAAHEVGAACKSCHEKYKAKDES